MTALLVVVAAVVLLAVMGIVVTVVLWANDVEVNLAIAIQNQKILDDKLGALMDHLGVTDEDDDDGDDT